jgi:hypothetical protein
MNPINIDACIGDNLIMLTIVLVILLRSAVQRYL